MSELPPYVKDTPAVQRSYARLSYCNRINLQRFIERDQKHHFDSTMPVLLPSDFLGKGPPELRSAFHCALTSHLVCSAAAQQEKHYLMNRFKLNYYGFSRFIRSYDIESASFRPTGGTYVLLLNSRLGSIDPDIWSAETLDGRLLELADPASVQTIQDINNGKRLVKEAANSLLIANGRPATKGMSIGEFVRDYDCAKRTKAKSNGTYAVLTRILPEPFAETFVSMIDHPCIREKARRIESGEDLNESIRDGLLGMRELLLGGDATPQTN